MIVSRSYVFALCLLGACVDQQIDQQVGEVEQMTLIDDGGGGGGGGDTITREQFNRGSQRVGIVLVRSAGYVPNACYNQVLGATTYLHDYFAEDSQRRLDLQFVTLSDLVVADDYAWDASPGPLNILDRLHQRGDDVGSLHRIIVLQAFEHHYPGHVGWLQTEAMAPVNWDQHGLSLPYIGMVEMSVVDEVGQNDDTCSAAVVRKNLVFDLSATFGTLQAQALWCQSTAAHDYDLAAQRTEGGYCEVMPYADRLDPSGDFFAPDVHHSSAMKRLIGWSEAAERRDVTASGTYHLVSPAWTGALPAQTVRELRIAYPNRPYEISIEYRSRTAAGLDSQLPFTDGLLVRIANPNVQAYQSGWDDQYPDYAEMRDPSFRARSYLSGYSVQTMLLDLALPRTDPTAWWARAKVGRSELLLGETYCSPRLGLRIRFASVSAGVASASVELTTSCSTSSAGGGGRGTVILQP